jgi:hypothetical protein
MNTEQTYWIPDGDLTPSEAMALAVPASVKPSREVYRDLLARKLQKAVDLEPREALAAMEMSLENLPEIYLIAQDQPPKYWGTALVMSDTVSSLLNRIDWSQPGSLKNLPLQSLREMLEQMP